MESVGWHSPLFEEAVTCCVKFLIVEGFGSHFPPHAFTAHGVAVEKVIYWLESHLFGFLLVQVHLLACLAHPVHPVHPVHLAMNNRGKAGIPGSRPALAAEQIEQTNKRLVIDPAMAFQFHHGFGSFSPGVTAPAFV